MEKKLSSNSKSAKNKEINDIRRAEILAYAIELRTGVECMTYDEIVESVKKKFGYIVSRRWVSERMSEYLHKIHLSNIKNLDEHRLAQLAKLRYIEEELKDLYENSGKPLKIITKKGRNIIIKGEEDGEGKDAKLVESTTTTRQVKRNPVILAQLLIVQKEIHALLGLYAPQKVEHSGNIDPLRAKLANMSKEEVEQLANGGTLPIDEDISSED